MRKFTPKSSDLRTYYLPGGQTDAGVFVKRNIDISPIYEAVLNLFQFLKQKWLISCCLLVTAHAWDEKGREVNSSRGYKVKHVHSCYSIIESTKGGNIFYCCMQ